MKFIAFFILLFCFANLQAQNLEGRTLLEYKQGALSQVLIYNDLGDTTVSDSFGRFKIAARGQWVEMQKMALKNNVAI